MKYNKVITYKITINNPEQAFTSGELDKYIFEKLKSTYEGVCYFGSYIKSVNKIVRREPLSPDLTTNVNTLSCNIKFEVTVIEYNSQDIITDVKVNRKSKNREFKNLIGYSKYGLIVIQGTDYTDMIKDNQVVPVRVMISKYPTSKDKIMVKGALFIPNYYVHNLESNINLNPYLSALRINVDKIPKEQFKVILDMIAKEEAKSSDIKKLKSYKLINDLHQNKKSKETINIMKLIDNNYKDVYVSRLNVPKHEPIVEIFKKEPKMNIVHCNDISMISLLLTDYYIHLKNFNNMVKFYEGKEKEYNALWTIYKTYKED